MVQPPEKEKTLAGSGGTIEADSRDENSSTKFRLSRFVAWPMTLHMMLQCDFRMGAALVQMAVPSSTWR